MNHNPLKSLNLIFVWALKGSSTLNEIKSVRAALEDALGDIANFKDFLELRRSADKKIERIETEMGLLIDLDDETRKGLELRISNAKRALILLSQKVAAHLR